MSGESSHNAVNPGAECHDSHTTSGTMIASQTRNGLDMCQRLFP